MAITRQKKEEIVRDLNEAFSSARVAVFTAFQGMNVASLNELRRGVRESGGRYLVAKKTLLKRALGEQKIEGLDPTTLEGEVGVAFGTGDPSATSKAVYQVQKDGGVLQILGGIMDGQVLSAQEVVQFATLPTREELLAKMVGSMNAPMSGMVNVFSGVQRNFVYALKAIGEQKS